MILFMTQNTIFVNPMTQGNLFSAFMATFEEKKSDHNPGSAQDWRISSDLWRHAEKGYFFRIQVRSLLCLVCVRASLTHTLTELNTGGTITLVT